MNFSFNQLYYLRLTYKREHVKLLLYYLGIIATKLFILSTKLFILCYRNFGLSVCARVWCIYGPQSKVTIELGKSITIFIINTFPHIRRYLSRHGSTT